MEPQEIHMLTVRNSLDTLGKTTESIAYASVTLKKLLLFIMMIGKLGLVDFWSTKAHHLLYCNVLIFVCQRNSFIQTMFL